MIRLLLNENFPEPSAQLLRQTGLDIVSIREDCPGWPDEAVLARAVAEKRWIVTFDRDYGDLIYQRKLPPPPAIVLLRERHYLPDEPARWVMRLTDQHARYDGRFVVCTRGRIRARPLLNLI